MICGDAVFGGAQRLHATAHGVEGCESASVVCGKATLFMSAVTASNTLVVAQKIARAIRPGTVFHDLNSASPGTKQKATALIEAADCGYEAMRKR